MRTTAIIVAAGRGERMGGGLPKQFLPCAGRPLAAHALSRFCRAEGIELAGVAFDSMVASYLLRSGERGHDIDTLAFQFLNHRKIPTSDLLGKGTRQISMLDVETTRLADYAGEDKEDDDSDKNGIHRCEG